MANRASMANGLGMAHGARMAQGRTQSLEWLNPAPLERYQR